MSWLIHAPNPVDFDGVTEKLIPSNSMELKRPSMSGAVFSKFTIRQWHQLGGLGVWEVIGQNTLLEIWGKL
jgi:hypothetical protein